MDPTRAPGSVRPTRSPRVSGKLGLRGTAPSLNIQPNLNYSFGDRNGPQTPQSAIPAGAFQSPEASPVPSPTAATEISLSAISSFQNPIYGFAADPQKLAASWVTNQHYGEAADQVRSSQTTLMWLCGSSSQFRACASLQEAPGCRLRRLPLRSLKSVNLSSPFLLFLCKSAKDRQMRMIC